MSEPAPAATAAAPPSPPPAGAVPLKIPSLARRVTLASIRMILTLLAIVVVPVYLLRFVTGAGLNISTPIAVGGIVLLGVLFAAVGAARYIARPTRLFGPMTVVASLVSIAYLLYLIPLASIGFQPDTHIGIAIDFGRFLQYCLIAPVFGIAAGVVTTVEDFSRPRERLEYEYAA